MTVSKEKITRCTWVPDDNELYVKYHDFEWGVPVHDDRKLFEMLTLAGAQAGLSWLTILKRREGYSLVFDDFDVIKIARYSDKRVAAILSDARIIRNRQKVESTVNNAKICIKVQDEFESFDNYLWSFVDHRPIVNTFKRESELPVKTALSDIISKDMKKRGFKFVGSTSIYAFIQGIGMVNDHTTDCFRYHEVNKLR
jgi:DNA-3-methyladenine glycosylase I